VSNIYFDLTRELNAGGPVAALAWDLWFDLMQSTNDADPPYTHGVLAYLTREELGLPGSRAGTPQAGGSPEGAGPV